MLLSKLFSFLFIFVIEYRFCTSFKVNTNEVLNNVFPVTSNNGFGYLEENQYQFKMKTLQTIHSSFVITYYYLFIFSERTFIFFSLFLSDSLGIFEAKQNGIQELATEQIITSNDTIK